MAQSGKGRLNYRCPSCFMRDLDIDMFYDVLAGNETVRIRYKAMYKRYEKFDFD